MESISKDFIKGLAIFGTLPPVCEFYNRNLLGKWLLSLCQDPPWKWNAYNEH